MFLATFFSGLALDGVRAGTIRVPFVSDVLFNNATEL